MSYPRPALESLEPVETELRSKAVESSSRRSLVAGPKETSQHKVQTTYVSVSKVFRFIIGLGISGDVGSGRVRRSPAYDLLSTLPYGDHSMALEFEGRLDNLTLKDFLNFGERHGVRGLALHDRLQKLATKVAQAIPQLPNIGLKKKQEQFLARTIEKRVRDLTERAS